MAVRSEAAYVTRTGMTINPNRAYFNLFGVDKIFNTIEVVSYQPLQEALQLRVVEPETRLILFEVGDRAISLPLRQMAFHHVAQGTYENQAWAAFFCAACNMGTAVVPVVNGQVHHFSGTGIYHGMVMMRDAETGSFWEHATCECVQGKLQGARLELIPAQYMLVKQVLEIAPDALIATSRQNWFRRTLSSVLLGPMLTPEGHMPAIFRLSMCEPDTRLPELQLGLGIWNHEKARFYAMDTLKTNDNAIIDRFDGDNLVIFVDPVAQVPIAHRCNATTCCWEGETLVLNTGERIRNGCIQAASSETRRLNAPNQQFVRWYAFSHKFPNSEIHGYLP